MPVETGEQVPDRSDLGQMFAEQPDRLGVRHLVGKPETEKPHERQPVLDLKFGLIVRQVVERLQDQNLEHKDRIIGRSAALRTVGSLQRLRRRLAEHLPRHDRVQLLQRIAGFAQTPIPPIDVPKSGLSARPSPPNRFQDDRIIKRPAWGGF